MSDITTYAKVKDGKIVEYPVYIEQIKARGLPETWYTKCTVDPKPETDDFTYAYQVPVIQDTGGVRVTWKTDALSLESLLRMLPINPDSPRAKTPRQPNKENNKPPSEAMITKIKALTEDRVQAELDKFANQRGYSDMERAISYIGDKNLTWSKEGKLCRDLRSDTWVALQAYFNDVTATPQVKPYPNTWRDIAVNLPALTWESEAL